MPPFRNPFSTRKPATTNGLEPINDENARPLSNGAFVADGPAQKQSVALSIKGNRDEPNEFKLSGKLSNQSPNVQRIDADPHPSRQRQRRLSSGKFYSLPMHQKAMLMCH